MTQNCAAVGPSWRLVPLGMVARAGAVLIPIGTEEVLLGSERAGFPLPCRGVAASLTGPATSGFDKDCYISSRHLRVRAGANQVRVEHVPTGDQPITRVRRFPQGIAEALRAGEPITLSAGAVIEVSGTNAGAPVAVWRLQEIGHWPRNP